LDQGRAHGSAQFGVDIGAIIRTAHSFLVREVFLIGTEPWYERAAMGMAKYEAIVECPDEAAFLETVRGRHLIGVERETAKRSENDGLPQVLLDAQMPPTYPLLLSQAMVRAPVMPPSASSAFATTSALSRKPL
jgi:hypothetical protein